MPRTARERKTEMARLAHAWGVVQREITRKLSYGVVFPTGFPSPAALQEAEEKVELMEEILELLERRSAAQF